MYQPTVGRWLSRDPIGVQEQTEIVYSHAYVANRLRGELRASSPQVTDRPFVAINTNLFAYVANSPTNAIDPSGLTPLDDFIDLIKKLDTAKKWKDAMKKPKSFNHADILKKKLTVKGLTRNEILSVIKVLGEFGPGTACGKWYKATYLAILNAGTKCRRSYCVVIDKGLDQMSGVAGDCLASIGTAAGGRPALNFRELAESLAKSCGKLPTTSKNCTKTKKLESRCEEGNGMSGTDDDLFPGTLQIPD